MEHTRVPRALGGAGDITECERQRGSVCFGGESSGEAGADVSQRELFYHVID